MRLQPKAIVASAHTSPRTRRGVRDALLKLLQQIYMVSNASCTGQRWFWFAVRLTASSLNHPKVDAAQNGGTHLYIMYLPARSTSDATLWILMPTRGNIVLRFDRGVRSEIVVGCGAAACHYQARSSRINNSAIRADQQARTAISVQNCC